jgi:ketosteroid isomerase-like protein
MSAKDIVTDYLNSFFNGVPDLAAVRPSLSDNFTFEGPMMTASSAEDFVN